MKKVYLASPLGFSEAGRKFYYEELVSLLVKEGFNVVDPWSLTPPAKINEVEGMKYGQKKREAWQKLNNEIAKRNKDAIDSSDMILAILDGQDVDSGTASEIGYAFANGKKILGYRGDIRLCGDNEGAVVNLQVEYFITESGGKIIRDFKEIPKMLSEL